MKASDGSTRTNRASTTLIALSEDSFLMMIKSWVKNSVKQCTNGECAPLCNRKRQMREHWILFRSIFDYSTLEAIIICCHSLSQKITVNRYQSVSAPKTCQNKKRKRPRRDDRSTVFGWPPIAPPTSHRMIRNSDACRIFTSFGTSLELEGVTD